MPHPTAASPTSQADDSPWLSSQQAAAVLGVQRASLYSYVSRGLLRAQSQPGQRGHVYARADVQRLATQRQSVRNPARLAQSTLDWGTPVLASAITQVEGGQLYYRGHLAASLAAHASLEEVAALLWNQELPATPDVKAPTAHKKVAKTGLPRRPSQALSAWYGGKEAWEPEMEQAALWPLALLQRMAEVLTGQPVTSGARQLQLLQKIKHLQPLHISLERIWATSPAHTDILRQTLVLCADHELNASSFATRVVASTGASLHASVGAGLAALSGPLHGGMTDVIASHWEDWHRAGRKGIAPSLRTLLADTRLGTTPHYCAGFGHPLYPAGDPRSLHLLGLLPPDAAREQLLQRVYQDTGLHPSLDYALVAIQRSLGLPAGAAFVLFALGRTAGWIAHALEQRAGGQLIRPRARYVGQPPTHSSDTHAAPRPSGRIIRF
ncbi:citrate synthase [Comamonas odontotermitis]|uniref:citrate synthase (unknown stereospecificity) n=1 Tax=Comamonas odontotermitis TaxID=379895 RepID=A0ABR6RJK0_9BURK|nr:citrate synthase family protein [Comamonas odontotermitis]MBB6579355.1 citrate synthase [Comamonas odontotermitis]